MAKVVQVIETEITRGRGDMGSPMRIVTQYWSFDGDLLAERDPIKDCIRGPANVAAMTGVIDAMDLE